MRKTFTTAIALVAAALVPVPAVAGIYGDDVTRCLVKSTSDDDKLVLIQWIFSGMALHPSIKAYSNITGEQRAIFEKNVAVIVTRLLTQTCRPETVAAIKYEGGSFLEKSFQTLGEVAMGSLMGNPEVAAGLGGWAKNLDKDAFDALSAEAGRPAPPKP